MLFADVRGYTSLAERISSEDLARLMNRFYIVATDVLAHNDAIIDKLIGDQVMALFIRSFTRGRQIEKMVTSTEQLLIGVGYASGQESWLPVGVGLDFGRAFVGNVGTADVKDFTALGDVVNTAARLQAEAKPGQIAMSERVYETVAERYPQARAVRLDLKGKSEPVAARIVDMAASPVTA